MSIYTDGLPEHGDAAEDLKRFEQERLAEIDGALGQLGRKIDEAERKSKFVIREVAPTVPET
jgi:hypothetical protein